MHLSHVFWIPFCILTSTYQYFNDHRLFGLFIVLSLSSISLTSSASHLKCMRCPRVIFQRNSLIVSRMTVVRDENLYLSSNTMKLTPHFSLSYLRRCRALRRVTLLPLHAQYLPSYSLRALEHRLDVTKPAILYRAHEVRHPSSDAEVQSLGCDETQRLASQRDVASGS